MKSPLESLKRHAILFALSYLVVCQTAMVAFDDDAFLKGESNIYFFGFDSKIGSDASKEARSIPAAYAPTVGGAQCEAAYGSFVNAAPVKTDKIVERSPVDHGDLDGQTIDGRNGASVLHSLVDRDAAFSIEESCEVDVVSQGHSEISGEFGEHPMPGLSETDAEGQSRAKQSERTGVCREQGPDPKGKVCSELMGNHENETETISSCVDNNTHSNRIVYHKTCNTPVRFVRPGGMGDYADITWESLEYMGRPWYWDRQIPAGRAYFIRKDDSHMVVDPRFLFEWTGPLTYPDQLAFTRLCGVRFFFRHERRMFEAVIDGITA